MNADNRCKAPAFFLPDPWTKTRVTGTPLLENLYGAVRQAVQDNAERRITAKSVFRLLAGAPVFAKVINYPIYLKLAMSARRRPWNAAMFLDLLLTDIFVYETKRTHVDFASLFLNSAAHIQHHYMFSSAAYQGEQKNPPWYAPEDADPLFDVYRLYDRIVAQLQNNFPQTRLMIATALHQEPHPEITFYWRLRTHEDFLRRLNVPFVRVESRMSRDFVVYCSNESDAASAAGILQAAISEDDIKLFDVDNRGTDVFVTLSYPREIDDRFAFYVGNQRYNNFRQDVVFVAIKNGQHSGIGYFIDTKAERTATFPLTEIPARIFQAIGV